MCSHDDDHIIVVALLYNYITIQVRTGVRTKCLFYPLHQQKHTHTKARLLTLSDNNIL